MNIKESELDYITECLIALRENRRVLREVKRTLSELKLELHEEPIKMPVSLLLQKLDDIFESSLTV